MVTWVANGPAELAISGSEAASLFLLNTPRQF